jgi:hypothetical protein
MGKEQLVTTVSNNSFTFKVTEIGDITHWIFEEADSWIF